MQHYFALSCIQYNAARTRLLYDPPIEAKVVAVAAIHFFYWTSQLRGSYEAARFYSATIVPLSQNNNTSNNNPNTVTTWGTQTENNIFYLSITLFELVFSLISGFEKAPCFSLVGQPESLTKNWDVGIHCSSQPLHPLQKYQWNKI